MPNLRILHAESLAFVFYQLLDVYVYGVVKKYQNAIFLRAFGKTLPIKHYTLNILPITYHQSTHIKSHRRSSTYNHNITTFITDVPFVSRTAFQEIVLNERL